MRTLEQDKELFCDYEHWLKGISHLLSEFRADASLTQNMDSNSISDFLGWVVYNGKRLTERIQEQQRPIY